jgi:hypothetical protein
VTRQDYDVAQKLDTSDYTTRTLIMALMLRAAERKLTIYDGRSARVALWDLFPDIRDELEKRQTEGIPGVYERHMYYIDDGTLDLQKMRDEASRSQQGDSRNPPSTVIIHFHRYGQPCDGFRHEHYLPKEGEIDVTRGYSAEATTDAQTQAPSAYDQ